MAVLRFEFHKKLKESVDYALKERGDEDVVSTINCDEESAAEQFKNTKLLRDKADGHQTFVLLQSFPPKERTLKTPEEFHELGKKLTEKVFPGFEAVIRTHTDKGHIHNHIVINTVHPETGVRITNEKQWGRFFGPPANAAALDLPEVAAFAAVYRASKQPENYTKRMLHVLRRENDAVAREAGLSVVIQQEHERGAKLSPTVRRMEQFKKDSWVLDLMQKANYARAYSTSYDEYRALLGDTFKIDVRVENKNIVYAYPGTQRRVIRGKKLGRNFDKAKLEESFANNDRMFATKPELRAQLRSEIDSLRAQPGRVKRDSSGVLLEPRGDRTIFTKDYGAYTPVARRDRAPRSSSEWDAGRSLIPMGEIWRAQGSILQYCEKHRIGLKRLDDGRTALKGREHVVVTHESFLNTKSNLQGSLIDFVAIHQNLTYVQAIAKINQNPRLLLLEQYWGERKRSFNAFYVPKPERAPHEKALAQASRLFRAWGAKGETTHALMQSDQLQVSNAGFIRLFGKGDGSGALEFTEKEPGKWQGQKRGQIRRALYAGQPQGNTLKLSLDPQAFLARHGEAAFLKKPGLRGTLALLAPEPEPVDHYINEHREISKVVLLFSNKAPTKAELDFFGVLKGRYQHLSIEVEAKAQRLERSPERGGPELSL